MSQTFTGVATVVRHMHAYLRGVFSVPEPEPVDYPFAPSDVAQLHRLTARAGDAALDDPTWSGLLLEEQPPSIPRWAGRTWPLFLGLLATLAAVALSPLAWLGVALVLYLLILVQVRYYERVQAWKRKAGALQLLLGVCRQHHARGRRPCAAPRCAGRDQWRGAT